MKEREQERIRAASDDPEALIIGPWYMVRAVDAHCAPTLGIPKDGSVAWSVAPVGTRE
jgi:hypothetical protein